MWLVELLLVFIAGVVVTIGTATYFFVYFLGKVETNAADKYKEAQRTAASSFEEMQASRHERLQEEFKGQTGTTPTAEPNKKPPSTYIKILNSPDEDNWLKPWNWVILKSNMLLQFSDSSATGFMEAIRLDGCKIGTHLWKKPGKPLWKINNTIVLEHNDRAVLQDKRIIYILFKTAKDLEQWYHLLNKASVLSSKKLTPEELKEVQFWQQISSRLTNYKMDIEPHWVTAILSRIFWNIQGTEGFIHFVTEKIRKKLSKVNLPSFVEEIIVREVVIGPNLPIFKDVSLIEFTDEGLVEVAGNASYFGGLRIKLEVKVNVKLPRNYNIAFPFVIAVEIKRITGKIHFHMAPPPSTCFWIGFYGEPEIELAVDTEFGENRKIKNLPKLANIIVYKIKQEVVELMVLPNMDDWPIPKISTKKVVNDVGTPEMLKENSTTTLRQRRDSGLEMEVEESLRQLVGRWSLVL